MLVKIKYTIEQTKIYDLTPEEVCKLHSGEDKYKYIPKSTIKWGYDFIDKEKAKEELDNFFYS